MRTYLNLHCEGGKLPKATWNLKMTVMVWEAGMVGSKKQPISGETAVITIKTNECRP